VLKLYDKESMIVDSEVDFMTSQIVRVQEKGQVTIPLEIRKKLNLKKGDLVTFVETDGCVIIKPAEVILDETLDEIGQTLKEKGISLNDLMERSRSIREGLIEEEYGIKNDSKKQ
jgi:antitoxin PrlF